MMTGDYKIKKWPAEIKQISAGPIYKPSYERFERDQLKEFIARPELFDQQIEKLFKVLAPGREESEHTYSKSELHDFACNYL